MIYFQNKGPGGMVWWNANTAPEL